MIYIVIYSNIIGIMCIKITLFYARCKRDASEIKNYGIHILVLVYILISEIV